MHPFTRTFLRNLPFGLQARWAAFEQLVRQPCVFSGCTFQFPVPGFSVFSATMETLVEIEKWMVINQRLRWAFKRLATAWLLRRLRCANETDLVTCEAPKRSVTLYDWTNRVKYAFEASTLMRTLREHLVYSLYLFPEPRFPRNPYTNQELTIGQLHFAIESLMRAGIMHWSLAAFKNTSYNLRLFKSLFSEPLRLKAFHRVFQNPTQSDCIELTVDFIEMEFEYHGVGFPLPAMWFWAYETRPTDPYLVLWRSYAESFYFLKYFPTLTKQPHAVESELLQLHVASYSLIRQSQAFRALCKAWATEKQTGLSVLE